MSDLTDRLRFLASGQDDPHSVAIAEAADALDAQAKEIAALRAELELRRKSGSATDRLHNLCESIAADADGSEFSRDEWDRIDAEIAALRAANRDLIAHQQDLRAEAERLNKCVQYEQHRADRIGTHGLECWKWGPTHYECALVEVERLTMALNKIAERTSSDDPCRRLVQIARDALAYPAR